MVMEKKKSKLQIKLESEGWRLLTNEDLMWDKSGDMNRPRLSPKTASELIDEYFDMGFRNIRVEQAYDIQGNLLSEHKAIYVKD
jgi:hypothetical protein